MVSRTEGENIDDWPKAQTNNDYSHSSICCLILVQHSLLILCMLSHPQATILYILWLTTLLLLSMLALNIILVHNG